MMRGVSRTFRLFRDIVTDIMFNSICRYIHFSICSFIVCQNNPVFSEFLQSGNRKEGGKEVLIGDRF